MGCIAVVDDHVLLAHALVSDLARHGMPALAIDADGPIVERVREVEADLVLLDLELGDGRPKGWDLIEDLVELGTTVIVLSGLSDEVTRGLCLERGAAGILSKDVDFAVLTTSIESAVAGGDVAPSAAERVRLSQALVEHRRSRRRRFEPFDRLTPREAAVLMALMQGRTAAEVSEQCVVSVATVRSQIKAILSKLEVGSQLQAVVLAHEVGWSQSGEAEPEPV